MARSKQGTRPDGHQVSTEEARTWPLYTQCNLGEIDTSHLSHLVYEIIDSYRMIHGYSDLVNDCIVLHIHYRPEDIAEAHDALRSLYDYVASLPDPKELSGDAYYFGNGKDGYGFTLDKTGQNLPEEAGPWNLLRPLLIDDGQNSGRPGVGLMEDALYREIKEQGFVLRGHYFSDEKVPSADEDN